MTSPLFFVNKKEMERISQEITDDLGEHLVDELRAQLEHIQPYYKENISPSIVYDRPAHLVGSEHWGAASIDDGSDWRWSKFPNIDKLKSWVRNRKDNGKHLNASDAEVTRIAIGIGKQIQDSGITPTFYVKSAISFVGLELDY